ncbi:hypothetical protein Ndes2526B_g04164 [Nannochloris sp. 'desiccata']
MLARTFKQSALYIIFRGACALSTTSRVQGLEEIIPKFPKEGEPLQSIGQAWTAKDLRQKSWDDLHKLWFVLAKERNLLQSEKLAYARARTQMPDPSRLTKVRKGMNRIKQVMSERLKEHEDLHMRMQLKAFIDSM